MEQVKFYGKNYMDDDKEIGMCLKSYGAESVLRTYHCKDDDKVIPVNVDYSQLVFDVTGEIIGDDMIDIAEFHNSRPHGLLKATYLRLDNLQVFDFAHTPDEDTSVIMERFFGTFEMIKLNSTHILFKN